MNIRVKGGQILSGEITPSGSKNSAVCLIPASILFDKPVILENIPDIADVDRLVKIMTKLGSDIDWNKETSVMKIDNSNLRFENLDHEDLGNMRGTSLFWGPMLARFKKVDFKELPGGCTLGMRPLDVHYEAFKALGVKVKEDKGSANMDASNGKANLVWLTEMSPTATENVIMFATSLKGITKIIGAASEPQVQDLCNFLINCGIKISGAGSSILEIEGKEYIEPVVHRLFSDHYEITTFMALAAVTGGEIRIKNAIPELFTYINYIFERFNVHVKYNKDTVIIEKGQKLEIKSNSLSIKAQPWPGLPVDLLPIFIPIALADGSKQVLFHNWMYESGLFWTSELTKLGANVLMADPHRVVVTGGNKLKGAKLEAPYIIRAVVAMVMSAMIAEGESEILNADALYRGHPHFVENLKKMGAKIEEIK